MGCTSKIFMLSYFMSLSSLDSSLTSSLESVRVILPPIRKLIGKWAFLRLIITIFLISWGVTLSLVYKFGNDRTRKEVEFYDNIFMGYKHSGVLTMILQLWIITIVGVFIIQSLPGDIRKVIKSG